MGYGPWGHRRVGHNLVTKQQKLQLFYFILEITQVRDDFLCSTYD